jgi:hypothetical protein
MVRDASWTNGAARDSRAWPIDGDKAAMAMS